MSDHFRPSSLHKLKVLPSHKCMVVFTVDILRLWVGEGEEWLYLAGNYFQALSLKTCFCLSHLQTKIIQLEKKLQCIKSKIDTLREEQESLSENNVKLKEQVKSISKAHKDQEVLTDKRRCVNLHIYLFMHREIFEVMLMSQSFPIGRLFSSSKQAETVGTRAKPSPGEA